MKQNKKLPAGRIRSISIIGDKKLREVSKPVTELDDYVRQVIADLIETMYTKDGVGLAAPQIGENVRIFVVDIDWFKTQVKNPLVFINPEFAFMEGSQSDYEGCLSLPGIEAEVKRADKIIITSLDSDWKKVDYEAEEFFARVIQHEYDHLDGILFIDRISKLKLLTLKNKLKNLESYTDENGVNQDIYIPLPE